MGNFGLFIKLVALWNLIKPYIGSIDIAKINDLFHKLIVDYNANNWTQLITDLLNGLQALLPAEARPLLTAIAKQEGVELKTPTDA